MKPNKQLIKTYLSVLLHEQEEKKSMTIEEIMQRAIEQVSKMNPDEKAHLRAKLNKSLLPTKVSAEEARKRKVN